MACLFSLCCACEVVLKFAVRYSICFSCESGDSLENHLSFQNLVQGLSLIITCNTCGFDLWCCHLCSTCGVDFLVFGYLWNSGFAKTSELFCRVSVGIGTRFYHVPHECRGATGGG